MRWLLHGDLAPAVAEALVRHGHEAQRSADLDLEEEVADPLELLQAAHKRQLDLITTDPGLVNAAYENEYPFGRSIVFLQLKGGGIEQDDAIDRLFERYKRLTPGRLYTVTGTRVKIRQLPGKK